MFICASGQLVRTLAIALLALPCLILAACGRGSSSPTTASGPLSGNWQMNLLQVDPSPQKALSVSGFLAQAKDVLTGSVQGPTITNQSGVTNCAGIALVAGTINGQNVTFSVNPGGTVFSFTGVISTDNTSMSGSYEAQGGACFTRPTTGTWTATLVPPLNGTFSGTLADSTYMSLLTGVNPPAPIAVSGTFTQSSNAGASNATLTGTITAIGYPCFTTVSLSGTISGQNVYMDVFDYSGVQIGTLGVPGAAGIAGTPATVVPSSNSLSLTGSGQAGLALGASGVPPCPALNGNGTNVTTDTTTVAFTLQ